MAKAKSFLSGKAKSVLKKNKTFKNEYGQAMGLPAGIDNGKGVVTDLKFGTYDKGANKGKPYFRLAFVCKSPKQVDAYKNQWDADEKDSVQVSLGMVDVEGTQDSIMEPLHSTPNRKRATEEDHWAFVFGMLSDMGLDPGDLDGLDDDELKELLGELVATEPVIKFRTWIGEATKERPTPRPGVNILSLSPGEEGDEEEEDDDDVDEDVDEEEEVDEDEDSEDEEEDSEDEEEDEEDEDEEETEEDDEPPFGDKLDDLVGEANSDDEDAQTKLYDLAKEAGIEGYDDDDVFGTWEDLAQAIRDTSGDEEEDEEDDEEDFEPEKGETYLYKHGRARKAQFKVTAVNKRNKTVNLKALKGDKTHMKVAWDKLDA